MMALGIVREGRVALCAERARTLVEFGGLASACGAACVLLHSIGAGVASRYTAARLQCVAGTAGCGAARPVVWAGDRGDPVPDPINL